MRFLGALSLGLVGPVVVAPLAVALPIAGTAPSARPEGAPTIERFDPPEGWMERALRGISEPIPGGLEFLQDQGAWFTPFNHPNATGRYDIRGLHGSEGTPSG